MDIEKEIIVYEFVEAKKVLYAMFGKKIRYVLLTDAVTDFTTPCKNEPGRFDIHLTKMRFVGNQKLDIVGGALHEAAHVVFSAEMPEENINNAKTSRVNLLEDIIVNHLMSRRYRGAAKFINSTYDGDDPNDPASVWQALFYLNKTLLPKEGINMDYVQKHIGKYIDAFNQWLSGCLNTKTYRERFPIHMEFIEKLAEENPPLPTDVFSAISELIGDLFDSHCSCISKDEVKNSMQTLILNAVIQAEQDKFEKSEDAKLLGFGKSDLIDIIPSEPDDEVAVDHELRLKFESTAYIKSLEKSAYDHRMLSGSLSKKKLANFAFVKKGVIRPMFKRRESGNIANFLILLDGSGSMYIVEEEVKKITAALAAALNKRYKVIGAVFQGNELYVSMNGMPRVAFNGNTPARAALAASYDYMMQQEGEKYIIMISDMEFDDVFPENPTNIRVLIVSTTANGMGHFWKPSCHIDELPKKLSLLIANAR